MSKNGILTAFQFIFIASYADVISKSVDCIDVAGNNPSWSPFGSTNSVATCPTGYTVTSCGAKSLDEGNTDDIIGSYFHGNGCKSETRWVCPLLLGCLDGGGVKAYARCCNLNNYGSSFSKVVSDVSGSGDDDLAEVECPDSTKLIGCTGHVNDIDDDKAFDGTRMGTEYRVNGETNTCIARNGVDGNGARATAKCYDTATITDGYEFDCIVVWGNQGTKSTVNCPTDHDDYFMSSCNGYSPWSDLLRYNVGSEGCTVTKRGGDFALASAICCRMYKHTPNPTPAPTTNPTPAPTANPSRSPTPSPTSDPTPAPTSVPTVNPTPAPSSLPTETPTNDPTNVPSSDPTRAPTVEPSTDPTLNPTETPTPRPTLIIEELNPSTDNENEVAAANTTENAVNFQEVENKTNDTELWLWVVILAAMVCGCCCLLLGIVFVLRRKRLKRKHEQIVIKMTEQNVTPGSISIPDQSVATSANMMSPSCITDGSDGDVLTPRMEHQTAGLTPLDEASTSTSSEGSGYMNMIYMKNESGLTPLGDVVVADRHVNDIIFAVGKQDLQEGATVAKGPIAILNNGDQDVDNIKF